MAIGNDSASRFADKIAETVGNKVRKNSATRRRIQNATVLREDDDGTVWVQIAGGASQTPVSGGLSAKVKIGDNVKVVYNDGRYSLLGNLSTPATSDEVAIQALSTGRNAVSRVSLTEKDLATVQDTAKSLDERVSTVSRQRTRDVELQNQVNSSIQEILSNLNIDVDSLEMHVSLAKDGLYIILNEAGYKLRLANDGVYVIDPDGTIVSTFGENIIFSSTRPQYIGNDDAYIRFDGEGHIHIGGDGIVFGALSDLTQSVEDLENSLDQFGGFIRFDPAVPSLTLGRNQDVINTVMTNDSLSFNSGYGVVVSIGLDPDGFGRMDASRLNTEQLSIGDNWVWQRRGNGNLSLKYRGE